MTTTVFNNEQNAIKAIKEHKYKYVEPDKNYKIETYIKNNKIWEYSSTKNV